ncbi:MAG: RagB/SusD family nutrient uptake outer membrane protein [Mucilaginibacter polytrichastri]|nr:RagB/SusD family nutrient uptake outer membrane protein [Mucilaginibacter polytrichastri]
MKTKVIQYMGGIFLSGIILLNPGCKKFLSEEDPSNLSPNNFYTIAEHAQTGLTAVYSDTRFIGNGAGIFSSNWQLFEAPTGTSTTETAQNSDLNNLYGLIYDPNTAHITNIWAGVYKVIAQANLLLEKVPAINMDEAQKKSVLGQAQFLRAWAYFYAVRLWGDIPLITNSQTPASENFYPQRASKEDVYNQIVADLTAAEASGLPWTDVSGRVTMAAVKSELAIVYLTMAGQPLNKGQSHYTLAAAKAKEVIDYANANPGAINLFTTYNQLHDETQNNRVEHIFQIQYNTLVAGNPMDNMYPNFKAVTYQGQSGTGSTVPTRSFYNSFEAGDLRAKNQDGFFYTSYFTNGDGAPFELGAPYIFKHFNRRANGTSGVPGTRNNNLNMPVIRFAEVLLVYAEAQNEVGQNADAYAALKRIRDRAQLTTPATYTQAAFREAVWRERWHELCYEQITWFDMVRLQKVYNETTNGFDNFVGHRNLSSNQTLQAKHLLFPLPRLETQNNPNLQPQNPGY